MDLAGWLAIGATVTGVLTLFIFLAPFIANMDFDPHYYHDYTGEVEKDREFLHKPMIVFLILTCILSIALFYVLAFGY